MHHLLLLLLLGFSLHPFSLFSQEEDFHFDQATLELVSPPYNIEEYFLLLPDAIFDEMLFLEKGEMTAASRQKLLDLSVQEVFEQGHPYFIAINDPRNGYLRMNSAGDGEGAFLEMCYWNCPNGERLIAVNLGEWAMCCESSHLQFFHFTEDTWRPVDSPPFPAITFADFLKVDFKNLQPPLPEQELSISYQLPQTGKDISVFFDLDYYEFVELDPPLEYPEQLKWMDRLSDQVSSQELQLKWNDCQFEKQAKN